MSETVRKRIIDLLVERMRDIVEDSTEYANESAILRPSGTCESAGTLAGDIPRRFEVTIKTSTTYDLAETTFWRELGDDHPAPLSVMDGTFIPGTPTAIDGDLTFTITADGQPGDQWLIIFNNKSDTLRAVYPYYNALEDTNLPSLIVAPANETKNNQIINDAYDCRMSFVLDLQIDAATRSGGLLENLIGDISDEVSRDNTSYDNTDCLTYECYVNGVDLYDSDASPSAIGVIITVQVIYRHQFNNTRLRR